MIEINWLKLFRMQEIERTALKTGDRTLIELLEIVKQVTEGKRKDNVEWFCFSFLELVEVQKGQMTKKVVKIAIGPILPASVLLWQNKIEERCGAKIQSCDFDVGRGSEIFFVERIASATDIFSGDSVIRKKLNEPGGKEAIKKEIEKAVEKLDNAFKVFNDIVDAVMAM